MGALKLKLHSATYYDEVRKLTYAGMKNLTAALNYTLKYSEPGIQNGL
ncbi:hypothetical protein CEXT_352671, partial [Caerostris extrusa]